MKRFVNASRACRACRSCRQRDPRACRYCGVNLMFCSEGLEPPDWRHRLYTK